MHRIDSPNALPGGFFTEGDPMVPVPATEVSDDWLNAVQEEIAAVIGAAGITLDKKSNSQLLAAIKELMPDEATELVAGLVKLTTVMSLVRSMFAGMIVEWEADIIPTLGDGLPLGLELNGAIASLEIYPRLARKWVGEAKNATCPAWYKCDAQGNRTTAGGYVRLQDRRGEFPRGWDHGRGVDPSRVLGSAQAATVMHYPYLVRSSGSNSPSLTNSADRNLDSYIAATASSYYVPTAVDTGAGTTGEGRVRSRNVATMYIILV